MNVHEHLLTCLGEEGAEIAQDVSKCLRFGMSDRNVLNPTGPTNEERLVNELNDLLAVAGMLAACGLIPTDWQSEEKQAAKCAKVNKFMDYARAKGSLTMDADLPDAVLDGWLGAVNQPVVNEVTGGVESLLTTISDNGNFTREQCLMILGEILGRARH